MKLNPEEHPSGSRLIVGTEPYVLNPNIPIGKPVEVVVEEWSPKGLVKLRLPMYDNYCTWLTLAGLMQAKVIDVLPKEPPISFCLSSEPVAKQLSGVPCNLRLLVKRSPFTGVDTPTLQWRPVRQKTSTQGIIGLIGTEYLDWEDIPVVKLQGEQ